MVDQPSWVRDHELVCSQSVLITFLSALSGLVTVLDADRRIVWASKDFLGYLGTPVPLTVLGRRPGEALGCIHAGEGTAGCGSSAACYLCQAVATILESKRQDRRVLCRGRLEVLRPSGPEPLELEISAAPWRLEDRLFTVLTFR